MQGRPPVSAIFHGNVMDNKNAVTVNKYAKKVKSNYFIVRPKVDQRAARRSTLGDRAFPVAAARAWNALPARVRCEPSLRIFRRQLKTHLFHVSFSGTI